MLFFHAFNHFILFDNIIWFPLLGALTATIFLATDWPRLLLRRIKPAQQPSLANFSLRPAVPVFVVVWLAIQTLIPLRHYAIPGDERFTWEGLSFSWRLKTDWYQPTLAEISLYDPSIIKTNSTATSQIDRTHWNGEKVLYRIVDPKSIDWSSLPEIVVLSEPELGERIIYNSLAGRPKNIPSEAEVRARVNTLWQDLYGRGPTRIQRTVPPPEIAEAFASVLRSKGVTPPKSEQENFQQFRQEYGAHGNGKGMGTLRRIYPFAFENGAPPSAPWFLIDDPALLKEGEPHILMLNRDLWKPTTPDGLVIHTVLRDPEERMRLPAICLLGSPNTQDSPRISWDILRDISLSQAMHISTNPFLLQRYARRIADKWEKEYNSRPKIFARAAVSLNFRPSQCLVDEKADLANASVSHWKHNAWICDLMDPRIPRSVR